MMHTTVPADPRVRTRALIVVLSAVLPGVIFLYFFHGFMREREALSITSPHLAVEKMNAIRGTMRGLTLFSATALAVWLGYGAFSVHRAGQWPPPGWHVIYPMSIRTGRQASMVALLFFLLALAVLVYGVVLASFSGPVPEEEEITGALSIVEVERRDDH
jgi:hypothetical protein